MQNKKRILLTSPSSLNNGGVQRVLMTIVRNFSDSFVFDILTFNSIHNFYKEEFISYGGNIYCFNPKNKTGLSFKLHFIFKFKTYLKSILKKNNYFAVHSNSQFYDGIILKLSRKHNIKIRISHAHRFYKREKIIKELYRNVCRKTIIKNATNLLGCSELACRSFFGPDCACSVVNNPYDSKNIKFTNKTPKELSLIQIGLFSEVKNQLFSLEVLYYIKKALPSAKLHLIGNGEKKFIENRINSLHLESNVFVHAQDADKNLLFENGSYLIMPSLSEGFGIVLIEAQASGMYCFASDSIPSSTNVGGVFFFSLRDGPKEWAEKIVSFYKKNGGQKSMFDCSNFSVEHFNNDIRKIYSVKTL